MDKDSLQYADERDRSYGVAGMAVSLVLWDGESYLSAVSIDSPVGQSIEFTPAYGFSGNPRMMASLAWREMLKQFEMSTAMIMGNVMCRAYVGESRPVGVESRNLLRQYIGREGRELCSLEEDEIDTIFGKIYRNLDRVFQHPGVNNLVHDFARNLTARRRLSAFDVFEILGPLNRY